MTVDQTVSVLTPTNDEDAAAMVSRAIRKRRSLDIVGGATRRGLGRPYAAPERISSSKLRGIVLYEPSELVISARAGTPVAEIAATLDQHGQMLAFEPMDHRRILGTTGEPTIAGVTASNASGPRRVRVGAARDALLGVRFVNGRGEEIKAGGRVMKNVTGLDLAKVMCGSYGTLGFLTEVTFKVLPKPRHIATLEITGLGDREAIALLSAALGSPYEPTGAAHLPAGIDGEAARTLVRLEGFPESVAHRQMALGDRLGRHADVTVLDEDTSADLWRAVRDAAFVMGPEDRAIWRLSVAPSRAAAATEAVQQSVPDARWFYDWGGGLIWVSVPPSGDAGAVAIREAVDAKKGHATLVRAADTVRRVVPPFHPLSAAEAGLTAGIKRSFDPDKVFGPGRMYDGL